jgi:predicted DNA-binding protein (UPF0251 family)
VPPRANREREERERALVQFAEIQALCRAGEEVVDRRRAHRDRELLRLVEKLGASQREVARHAGVSHVTVLKWVHKARERREKEAENGEQAAV